MTPSERTFEVRLVGKLSGRLYWWVELCVSSLHPYIESAIALSDYEYIATNDGF